MEERKARKEEQEAREKERREKLEARKKEEMEAKLRQLTERNPYKDEITQAT